MIESISQWTSSELQPALSAVGVLTLQALDTLPLPMLVVGFLALLALLQWPSSRTPSLLPYYSPGLQEKGRLSPLPYSPPSTFPPQRSLSNSSPGFRDPFDSNGRAQYVAVINDPLSRLRTESGTLSPPRTGYASRRGSRQNSWRAGRLGVVDETPEEKLQV